jgi:dipeptidase E
VQAGLPYVGWSAGSNLACPTVRTTNDMPIVQPASFESLNLVPFQINPHYLDAHPEKHQGETREQRLLEFTALNPDVTVVGLREGSMLQLEGARLRLLGDRTMRLFRGSSEPSEVGPDEDLGFLLRG